MKKDETTIIWGGPTKRFFVSMLTRDIQLPDAILDLVDNCVDGATRTIDGKVDRPDAYKGFEARLNLSSTSFDLSDNCGGIPKDAIKDAFLLGRPKVDKDKGIPTIGMYGIGMKRAIFKIGHEAAVESRAADGAYSVGYTREWLNPDNDDWDLPIESIANKGKKGVTIIIPSLRPDISRHFGNAQFENDLKRKLSEHFGYIMQKGFSIYVNKEKLQPRTLQLYSSDPRQPEGVRPYDFEATMDDVHVRVTVGFYRPLSTIEEVDEATEGPGENEQAGVSVICNDRLVLENDKSMKTGWGDGGVAKYHPQFRGISGFIVFSTDNPQKLPISTTKRDLDFGSDLFLFARQYCMEGLRECIVFTNKWKGMEAEASELFRRSERVDVRRDLRLAAKHGTLVRGSRTAKKSMAHLPPPENRNPMRRISFTKKEEAIKKVSNILFGESDQKPAIVGQECFERILKGKAR